MRRETGSFYEALCMYAFGVFLLFEWLRPLGAVANVTNIWIFIVFVVVSFALSFFGVHWYIAAPVKGAAILLLLHTEYAYAYETGRSWFGSFLQDSIRGMELFLQLKWQESSVVFQTFLFFGMLWGVNHLFCRGMIQKRRILPFFLLTVVYVASLDTFTSYMGKGAIIRLVIIGFLMTAWMQMERLAAREGVRKQAMPWRVAGTLFLCIAAAAAMAYASPKPQPQWPDPVPFLFSSKSDETGKGISKAGTSKVGYSEDDSSLGGPFQGDDTVVFTTKVKKNQYWRVETKSIYTGKGWAPLTVEGEEVFQPGNEITNPFEAGMPTEAAEAEIDMRPGYGHTHVVYPAGLLSIAGEKGVYYALNVGTEKITPRRDGNMVMDQYTVTYRAPTFPIEQLQAAEEGASKEAEDIPPASSFLQSYTVLPDTLPQRVRDLAVKVTQGKTNRYDKASAIEAYLRGPNFTYEKEDVAIPGPEQDYVDQFLFETRKGYCNNFSTSMVVMLRSIGIPARWVKGYTEGEWKETDGETGMQQYVVTNNNAHSWAEVYFPDFGWVPFEPTKGFANPADFVNETTESQVQTAPAATPSSVQQAQWERGGAGQLMPEEAAASKPAAVAKKPYSWKIALLYGGAALVLLYLLFRTRLRWMGLAAMIWYKNRRGEDVYSKAYETLLKQLSRAGIKRAKGQTLREYAMQVDEIYRSTDMQRLTQSYEKVLYQRGGTGEEWERSAELWGQMMRRIGRKKAG